MPNTGFVTRTISWARKFTDKPEASDKYTDSNIIDLMGVCYAQILGEINRNAPWPVTARFDITISGYGDDQYYSLPIGMGKILRISILNDDGDQELYNIEARGRLHPYGPGFSVEGNTLFVKADAFSDDDIIRFEYAPSGIAKLHEGTFAETVYDATALTVTLSATPTKGDLDIRSNAYAGCMLRVLGSDDGGGGGITNVGQERIITAHAAATGVVTLSHALSPAPATGDTMTYEIAPSGLNDGLDMVIAVRVAMYILGAEGSPARYRSMVDLYRQLVRDVRLNAAGLRTVDNAGLRRNAHGRYNLPLR